MSPAVGDRAPELGLRDQHGAPVSLSSVRADRGVLLVFFPYAFSGVCTGELLALRDRGDEIAAAGGAVVGVSCDPMFSLRAFADRDGLEFPLLSDFWPHGAVASAYGVLDERHLERVDLGISRFAHARRHPLALLTGLDGGANGVGLLFLLCRGNKWAR